MLTNPESLPEWSDVHLTCEVLDHDDQGRPRAKMKVRTAPEATTQVKFELTINPLVPLPGFLLKRATKGVMGHRNRRVAEARVEPEEGGLAVRRGAPSEP